MDWNEHARRGGPNGNGVRERAFEIPVTARVTGVDAGGRRFEEAVPLVSISAREAALRLRPPLVIGTRIFITLDIPRTLILEKPLCLDLSGTVARVLAGVNGRGHLVQVDLDRGFRLQAAPAEPASR